MTKARSSQRCEEKEVKALNCKASSSNRKHELIFNARSSVLASLIT